MTGLALPWFFSLTILLHVMFVSYTNRYVPILQDMLSKPGQLAGVSKYVTVIIAKKKSPFKIVVVVMYDEISSS